jgi:hypothetical protein
LEAGPPQGSSGLQRTFTWFFQAFASLTFPFQTELVIDIHTIVTDMQRNALTGQEGASGQNRSVGGIF